MAGVCERLRWSRVVPFTMREKTREAWSGHVGQITGHERLTSYMLLMLPIQPHGHHSASEPCRVADPRDSSDLDPGTRRHHVVPLTLHGSGSVEGRLCRQSGASWAHLVNAADVPQAPDIDIAGRVTERRWRRWSIRRR